MLQNAIAKMVSKYISAEESNVTDFHIKVNGENGELTVFDDDDSLIARVHIKEWGFFCDRESPPHHAYHRAKLLRIFF